MNPKLADLPSNLKLTAPVEVQLADEPKEGESPSRPRFTIAAYSGAPIEVGGFFSPVILELSGMKADRQRMPVLRDHDPSRIVGISNKVDIDAQGVRLEGTVTGENPDATEVVSQARNGFDWQASIGADFVRREFLKPGEKAQVNGREVTGPMIIGRETLLRETSFVALGADHQTSAQVAATADTDPQKVTLAALHKGRQS